MRIRATLLRKIIRTHQLTHFSWNGMICMVYDWLKWLTIILFELLHFKTKHIYFIMDKDTTACIVITVNCHTTYFYHKLYMSLYPFKHFHFMLWLKWPNGLIFLNWKLRVWPPDLPDLVNYNYVLTFFIQLPSHAYTLTNTYFSYR